MAEKKYYWLKLKDEFFDSLKIKKLRSIAGGDTYTIIYLKMLLAALKTDGILEYQGIEDNVVNEIAMSINENPDDVGLTIQFLLKHGLAEQINDNCFLPEAVENVGSETKAAERMRNSRERARQMRNIVTPMLQDRYTHKEIEIDIDNIPPPTTNYINNNINNNNNIYTAVAPQPIVAEYREFVDAWNSIPHTVNITDIIPLTARDDEFRICLSVYGKEGVMNAIQKIRDSEYLQKRNAKARWDKFINRNVIQNVLEGSYDEDYNKVEETDGIEFSW